MANRSFVLHVMHQSALKSTNTGRPDAIALSSDSLLNCRQANWVGLLTNPYAPAARKITSNIAAAAKIRERDEETGVQKEPLIQAKIAITKRIAPREMTALAPFIW